MNLQEAMRRGIATSETGDKAGAYEIFKEISTAHPDSLETWVWMGWTSPTLDEAEAAFSRAHELDPGNPEANLGLRYVKSQRQEQSNMHSSTDNVGAPAGEPSTGSTPTGGLGGATEAGGHDATSELEEGMRRGIAAVQSGDKLVAYNIFKQMTSSYPNTPETWVWLGGTSLTLDDAESAFLHATDLDPSNDLANMGLRWVTLRRQAIATGQGFVTGPTSTTDALASGSLDSTTTASGRLPGYFAEETSPSAAAAPQFAPAGAPTTSSTAPAPKTSRSAAFRWALIGAAWLIVIILLVLWYLHIIG